MHTFAVVTVRRGRSIPDHVLRVLASPDCADITFSPEDHVHWRSDEGSVHFAGWQAGHQHLGIDSHWHQNLRTLTAFSGHPWLDAEPWTPGGSWASQLAIVLADPANDLTSVSKRLDGVFTLVHLDADGRGGVTSDPFGVGIIYKGCNDTMDVFSNRAALVARMISPHGVEPRRDVEGALSLVYTNTQLTERTGFSGVTAIPQASTVQLAPGREPQVRTWSTTPWIDPDIPAGTPAVELVQPVATRLRRLIRTISSLPTPILTMELTGGRDSRMMLALLLAERLQDRFTFVTWGSPSLPDVVSAGHLADRFDLDLRAEGRARKQLPWRGELIDPAPALAPEATTGSVLTTPAMRAELSYEESLRRHVWMTSGSVSIWDLFSGSRDPSPTLALCGQFGEAMRTNYSTTDGIGSMSDLELFVRHGGFKPNAAHLLRRSARRRFDDRVVRIMHEMLPAGGTVQDAVDGYYLSSRIRRWFGSAHELDNRNRMFPLYSLEATRAAFALSSTQRRREVMPFELIQATCPELATIAFAGAGWPASLIARQPDGDRYPSSPDAPRWRRPTPRERFQRWRSVNQRQIFTGATGSGLTSEQRRMADIDKKIPVLLELVDLGPRHELFDHLDYDATIRAVSDVGGMFYSGRRAVHDAVTAAIWLGRADAAVRL